MTSLQEQYSELLALTQLHLLQTHGTEGQLIVAKDSLPFFGVTPGTQKPRQPIPEPVHVRMIQPQPITAPAPVVQKQEIAAKPSPQQPQPEIKVIEKPPQLPEPPHEVSKTVSTPHVDFKEMHDIVRKLFPSLPISKDIPAAAATGVIIVNDSTEPAIAEFVQKVAEAIRTRLGHETKIVVQHDPHVEAKFVIASEKQVQNTVRNDNVLVIPNWEIYLHEPQRKTDLWQSMIKLISK